MKLIPIVILAAAAFTQNALGAEAKSNTTLVGAWAVDTSRLPMAPSARPKSVTITFSDAGAERIRTKVEVIDPAGGRLDADGVTPLDGSPTPVTPNFESDMSSTLMPRPEVLIMQLAKNGSPASTRIYAVNADGKTMVETVAYFSAEGKPMLRKNYFSRVR